MICFSPFEAIFVWFFSFVYLFSCMYMSRTCLLLFKDLTQSRKVMLNTCHTAARHQPRFIGAVHEQPLDPCHSSWWLGDVVCWFDDWVSHLGLSLVTKKNEKQKPGNHFTEHHGAANQPSQASSSATDLCINANGTRNVSPVCYGESSTSCLYSSHPFMINSPLSYTNMLNIHVWENTD